MRTMAEQYGIPVILHTDHCAKKLLPWVDGLLAASERYHAKHKEDPSNQRPGRSRFPGDLDHGNRKRSHLHRLYKDAKALFK